MSDELAAMANTGTGTLVLGVDDKTREVIGIPDDKLAVVDQWLQSILGQLIDPPLQRVRVEKVTLFDGSGAERTVLRIDIPRSLFVHKSHGGYFIRTHESKQEMNTDLLARLLQQRSLTRVIRFDEQVVAQAPLDALDEQLSSRFRTSLSDPDPIAFLKKLKLCADDEEGELRPTVGGLLMASSRPDDYVSSAYIQAVAYRGAQRDSTYQLDAKDIYGPLDRQVWAAFTFVKRNMRTAATKDPMRIDLPQFDERAVFEALVNAVAHRDYSIYGAKVRLHMFSDRLELHSPGAIPNTMTVESMSERQVSRNELVTSLLARCPVPQEYGVEHRACMMDRRGEGVPIIIQESVKLSGQRPEYQLLDDTELRLTLYAANVDSE